MADDRVDLLHQRMEALRLEEARLGQEHTAAVAARAAGANHPWAAVPPLFLRQVLERLEWQPAVCAAVRGTCSTWGRVLDAWFPGPLRPRSRLSRVAIMEGKMRWFQRVTEVNLAMCEHDSSSGVLAELSGMPSLRTLTLPSSCAESAADAEALCGLTQLTTLRFRDMAEYDDAGNLMKGDPFVREAWVLDLSKLTTLTCLEVENRGWLLDDESGVVQKISSLSRLSTLTLTANIHPEGMRAVCRLPALTFLFLNRATSNVDAEGMRELSRLTALTTLHLNCWRELTDDVLCSLSGLPALTTLGIYGPPEVSIVGLRALSSLPALQTLSLCLPYRYHDRNVTAEELMTLYDALPHVLIEMLSQEQLALKEIIN